MGKYKKNIEKIDKKLLLNILFGIIILFLIVILIIKSVTTEPKMKINNPYDITVSDTDNFVLLGDSITEWYPVEEFYDKLPVINSGTSGFTTKDVLENLKSMMYVYNPTKVFLLIGTNDIKKNVNENDVIKNIQKIIEEIQILRPKVKIYLESIYPINNTDNEKIREEVVGDRTNHVIKSINKKLKEKYKDTNVTYIDVYNELLDKNGNMDLKYTIDGLHLSNLGYLRVTKTILPYFQD